MVIKDELMTARGELSENEPCTLLKPCSKMIAMYPSVTFFFLVCKKIPNRMIQFVNLFERLQSVLRRTENGFIE